MKKLLGFAVAMFVALPLFAQAEDAEGCKDSPLLSRMNGCTIDTCEKKDFDEGHIQVGLDADANVVMKSLEGSVETIQYTCPGNLSALAIVRNAENALKAGGFSTVFSGKGDNDRPSFTGRKANAWINVTNTGQDSMTYYTVTIIHTKEMEQQMVSTADAMEDEINKSGSVSIYGINFDTGKATIKTESNQTLNEVAKLLKKNSAWKMQVEGHTDNVGTKDANMKLSQARADAVRAWLIGSGVDGTRLIARGFGDTKPVAGNGSEEGRAKNRRVALVKL